jgi:GNAT superfamily N-acetyltransferase
MNGPVIRAAHAKDAGFLAWAILAASRGHLGRGWFDIALNQPEAGCLGFLKRLSVTSARSWWHYSRFIVAETAGEPVAALSAFRAGDAYPLSQAAMDEAADALGLPSSERSAIWQRGAYIFLCASSRSDDCWTLENIATLPSYRRRGLTTALLDRAIEEGRRHGLAEAQITFLVGNESAERAYVRAGFHPADERRHPDSRPLPGHPVCVESFGHCRHREPRQPTGELRPFGRHGRLTKRGIASCRRGERSRHLRILGVYGETCRASELPWHTATIFRCPVGDCSGSEC